ncbi:MAG: polyamine aminopropyltransferase [bacterium]|nr:MAG: polyamine aminopropyltransferase [bacterium]
MSIWYTEKHTPHSGITIEVKKALYHAESPFQSIDVLDTYEFGKVLLLDGLVMLTERDEFVYHEMLAHVPLLTHPRPRNVLVVGGGDGGTVREVLKHATVEAVTLVEIDRMVVETSLEYLPEISAGLGDSRVSIVYEDGVKYLDQAADGTFDAILVDSTDPVGAAEALFSADFFRSCRRALTAQGVFASQTESPFYHMAFMKEVSRRLSGIFGVSRFYFAPVTTYPSGNWSFVLGQMDPGAEPRLGDGASLASRYYTPEIHTACFARPRFLVEALQE